MPDLSDETLAAVMKAAGPRAPQVALALGIEPVVLSAPEGLPDIPTAQSSYRAEGKDRVMFTAEYKAKRQAEAALDKAVEAVASSLDDVIHEE